MYKSPNQSEVLNHGHGWFSIFYFHSLLEFELNIFCKICKTTFCPWMDRSICSSRSGIWSTLSLSLSLCSRGILTLGDKFIHVLLPGQKCWQQYDKFQNCTFETFCVLHMWPFLLTHVGVWVVFDNFLELLICYILKKYV